MLRIQRNIHTEFVCVDIVRRLDGRIVFRMSTLHSNTPRTKRAHWVKDRKTAKKLIRVARSLARGTLTIRLALKVMHEAAHRHRIALTPHKIFLKHWLRATETVNQRMGVASAMGLLATFNAEYKRRRIEAKARGHGFMNYEAAKRRLANVVLANQRLGNENEVFARVFNEGPCRT